MSEQNCSGLAVVRIAQVWLSEREAGFVSGTPWLRVNRVMRMMLHTRWSAEAWSEVRVEFERVLALRSKIRRGVIQPADG